MSLNLRNIGSRLANAFYHVTGLDQEENQNANINHHPLTPGLLACASMDAHQKQNIPQPFHQETVGGVDYIFTHTQSGMVIQSKADYHASKHTGIFIGNDGKIVGEVAVGQGARKALDQISERLLSLSASLPGAFTGTPADRYCKLELNGKDFLATHTRNGVVFQLGNDFQAHEHSGIYSDGNTLVWDGDVLALQGALYLADSLSSLDLLSQIVRDWVQRDGVNEGDSRGITIDGQNFTVIYTENGVYFQAAADLGSQDGLLIPIPDGTLKLKGSLPSIRCMDGMRIALMTEKQKRRYDFNQAISCYEHAYAPSANRQCLEEYYVSDDFQRHAQTATAYYNSVELSSKKDVGEIIDRREPTNLYSSQRYHKEKLIAVAGYGNSAYNEVGLKKEDGTSFRDVPNSVSLYSETYMWEQPGNDGSKKEIAVLCLPAPALDDASQPHHHYFIKTEIDDDGKQIISLRAERYEEEMKVLAKMVVTAALDHKDSAFKGAGIQRIVIPLYGQEAFLSAVPHMQKPIAHEIFYRTLRETIAENEGLKDIEIVMSTYSQNPETEKAIAEQFLAPLTDEGFKVGKITGDIVKTSQKGDLIINAWDPHSCPGNGNDGDRSFDGAMGLGSGILPCQWSHLNPLLKDQGRYKPI